MSEENTPAVPPNEANPDNKNTPPGNPNGQNNGGDGAAEDPKVEISKKELDALRSNAGRWESHRAANPDAGKSTRRRSWEKPVDEGGDGESSELRKSRAETRAAKIDVFKRDLKDTVAGVLDSEAYKNISPEAKILLNKNPAAYIDPRSLDGLSLEDAKQDIEDFLDKTLVELTSASANQEDKLDPKNGTETPPAGGSPPTLNKTGEESIEGKTGTDRSKTVLRNLMKRQGIKH